MTARDWDAVGFVVRQPVYAGSIVRNPRQRTEQPLMVDRGFHRRHLDVQGSSTYNPANPFDLDSSEEPGRKSAMMRAMRPGLPGNGTASPSWAFANAVASWSRSSWSAPRNR